MNYIFIESSYNLGGIESLIIEMTLYLTSRKHSVTIVSRQEHNPHYKKIFKSNPKVQLVQLNMVENVENSSKKQLASVKRKFDEGRHINKDEQYSVIGPYFDNIQIAMFLFENKKNVKLLHLWGHPEDWKNTLGRSSSMDQKRIKGPKYEYQRNLLQYLSENNADFYGASVVPIYNNFYYNLSLPDEEIITFPIKDIGKGYSYNFQVSQKKLKVLWCGRFDYWKNEAIVEIYVALEKLSLLFKEYQIEYTIIGYGSEKYTADVHTRIKEKNVKVNYLGIVELEKLAEVMSEYDLGIGMGLTVKKMGQVKLPSILVDSVDKGHIDQLKADWLFNTKNGDAGDGYYYDIANSEIKGRKPLYDLLYEVLQDPAILNKYSKLSYEFVREHYDEQKQMKAFFDAVENSKLTNVTYPVYQKSKFEFVSFLLLRKIYRLLKKLLRK